MWGIIWRVVVSVPVAYLLSMVVEPLLGHIIDLMEAAPADGSNLIAWTTAIQSNFFLLCLLGLVVAIIARAQVESKLGGY